MSKLHRPTGRCRSPGGPHRPADRCRFPGGPHRPTGRCLSPDGAESPGWPLPVPGWDPPLRPPGGLHRSADRCRFPGGPHRPAGRCRSSPQMGRTARLAAAGRVPRWVASPGWPLPVPRWDPPLCPPGGLHRSAGCCRSPDGSHRPASRCRSSVGLYRSVPRMGRTARWSLPVPGWAIPLDPPDGPHRPLVAAGPRLGYTARSPGWAAPPS